VEPDDRQPSRRALPPGGALGRRRYGRDLPRAGHAAGAPGGRQAAPRLPRLRSGVCPAPGARGPHRRLALPPQHRQPLRPRSHCAFTASSASL
ncbi:MAG: Serine/threonine protein kinase PrkC, regulator of stationary phase, partial [uncultured Chloroflexi bacterium]